MNDIDEQETTVDNTADFAQVRYSAAAADEVSIEAQPDNTVQKDLEGAPNGAPEPKSITGQDPETTQDTFPRAYVEDLRRENANYRTRAQQADQLAQRLHTELVRQLGALQDPSDLPFDEAHLEDPESLQSAVDALLAQKPHLRSRRVSGDIGQGATKSAGSVDLLGLLRGGA